MTFTTNDCFLDSSILIEYNKGSKTELFIRLTEDETKRCFINETVLSEFLFHFLAKNGAKAPLTIKSNNSIKEIFNTSKQYQLINLLIFIPNDIKLFTLVPTYMALYNLLPNDAIILATCKLNGITQLASHDADFVGPCVSEGIELLLEG